MKLEEISYFQWVILILAGFMLGLSIGVGLL